MSQIKFPRRFFLRLATASTAFLFLSQKLFSAQKRKPVSITTLDPSDPIVRAAIYPGIGVARIGSSQELGNDFYDGPEVDSSVTDRQWRDGRGALKRQAQRFHVYGYTQSGKTVELTADNAQIDWRVELANKKSSWYRFDVAMDLEESRQAKLTMQLRNAQITARESLNLRPGERKISGRNLTGKQYQFGGVKFMGIPVNLGELRTDESGRLRVLGGLGHAGTPDPKKYPVFNDQDWSTFNNADGWYDDIADGPVFATVKVQGQEIATDPAWVVVAPPKYAPDIKGFRTFYDLLLNLYLKEKPEWVPDEVREQQKTSFTQHILPLLERMSQLQWVNKGFANQVGFESSMDLQNPQLLQKLNSNSSRNAKDRDAVYQIFRLPSLPAARVKDHRLWPMLYGDAYGSFDDSLKNIFIVPEWLAVHLKNWREGKFASDWNPQWKPIKNLSEIPVEQQPAMLNKAALDFCLADAFHPGCEMTWPMRHLSIYRSAFRIKYTPHERPATDTSLTVERAMAQNGPLHEQAPGDLTKWMAVPWHGDTAFCRSGYEPQVDPYLPTFWPAAVPNHVLSQEDYAEVMDQQLPLEMRKQAFQRRSHWLRMLNGSAPSQIVQMVSLFADVGVIEAKAGPPDGKFPAVLFVENLGPAAKSILQKKRAASPPAVAAPPPPGTTGGSSSKNMEQQRLMEAGWESAEQLQEFRKIRKHRVMGK